MKVKSESEVAQLCPTPSDPMDCSLPGSSAHGIFQARVLEWVAIPFPSIPGLGRSITSLSYAKLHCFNVTIFSGCIRCDYFIKWRRQWQPTPVLLPGKSHGQRSLVGCNPWGCTESDTTERLHFHFSLSCIGEGNGNPLQCSCLENPRDGRAWWAAVYGVTQSWTRLK